MKVPAMKVVVVGGGISGLAAAHRLTELARERQTPLELTLIEARERLGGTIVSERVDGFVVEAGARPLPFGEPGGPPPGRPPRGEHPPGGPHRRLPPGLVRPGRPAPPPPPGVQ